MAKDYSYFKKKAKIAFQKRDYNEALKTLSYAALLKDSNISKKESLQFEMLCSLADMANTHEDEARALWEYFNVIAKKNSHEAEELILSMIEGYDMNLYALNVAISHLQDLEIEDNDGVLFEDFKKLSQKIGFKEAFIDLMFSSKIIFTSKGDFLIFVKDLVENGFKDIAINYFENAGNALFYDKDFVRLYQKLIKL